MATNTVSQEGLAEWRHKVSEWNVFYSKIHSLSLAAKNDTFSPEEEQAKNISVLYIPWHSAINWGRRLIQEDIAKDPGAAQDVKDLGDRIDSAVLFANWTQPYYQEKRYEWASWWPSMRDYYEDLIMNTGEYIYNPGSGHGGNSALWNDAKEIWDKIAGEAKKVLDKFGLPVLVGGGVLLYLIFKKKS